MAAGAQSRLRGWAGGAHTPLPASLYSFDNRLRTMKIPAKWLSHQSKISTSPALAFLLENSETITAAQLKENTQALLDDYRSTLLANKALRMQQRVEKDGYRPTLAWHEKAPKYAARKTLFLWCMACAPCEFFAGENGDRLSSQDCRKYAARHIFGAMQGAYEEWACAAGVDGFEEFSEVEMAAV